MAIVCCYIIYSFAAQPGDYAANEQVKLSLLSIFTRRMSQLTDYTYSTILGCPQDPSTQHLQANMLQMIVRLLYLCNLVYMLQADLANLLEPSCVDWHIARQRGVRSVR